jgi:hypothetical protein
VQCLRSMSGDAHSQLLNQKHTIPLCGRSLMAAQCAGRVSLSRYMSMSISARGKNTGCKTPSPFHVNAFEAAVHMHSGPLLLHAPTGKNSRQSPGVLEDGLKFRLTSGGSVATAHVCAPLALKRSFQPLQLAT